MEQWLCILLLIVNVFASAVSQILLKKASNKNYSGLRVYLNPGVITGYGIFFVGTLVTTLLYKYIDLSLGSLIASLGYIFVAVLGRVFLKEKLSKKQLFGMGCILLGVIIFSSDGVIV